VNLVKKGSEQTSSVLKRRKIQLVIIGTRLKQLRLDESSEVRSDGRDGCEVIS